MIAIGQLTVIRRKMARLALDTCSSSPPYILPTLPIVRHFLSPPLPPVKDARCPSLNFFLGSVLWQYILAFHSIQVFRSLQ